MQTAQMAQQGNALAQTRMGQLLESGFGVPRDLGRALGWYELSRRKKTPSVVQPGRLLIEGKGIPKDPDRARRPLSRRCRAQQRRRRPGGHSPPAGAARECSPRATHPAVFWLRKAAELGDVTAQTRLAAKYVHGQGVAADPAEAVKWYEKASEAGDREAQASLGQLLLNGAQGLPRDPRAGSWLALAAGQGQERHDGALGSAFETGDGVARDAANAGYWYSRAAAAGAERCRPALERGRAGSRGQAVPMPATTCQRG